MSPLAYHGPGDRLDAHDVDATAHAAAFAAAAIVSPEIVAPPATMIAASSTATWYTTNAATLMRFSIPKAKSYRFINLYVGGVLSGNVQVGVCSVRRSGTTLYATRVMDSGVIAMSGLAASTDTKFDCGDTLLPSGEYGLFLWCDNTTATFMHSLATGFRANRLTFSQTISGGVPAAPTETGFVGTTRWVSGMTLESDYS